MPQTDVRNLSLMVFPQQWSGTEIVANILLVPSGDPTAAVGAELPFAQAQPVLRGAFLPGFTTPSWGSPPPGSVVFSNLFHLIPPGPEGPGLIQPPFKQDIFTGLAQQFTPTLPVRFASAGGIKKDLPLSYQAAAGFGNPDSALFTSGDGYGCDLRGTPPNTIPVTPRNVAWGEIFSYALRQPLIAQAIGMSYLNVHIPLTAATVAGGGWLWIEIDTTNPANWYAKLVTSSSANPYYQQPVRSYAARIPALTDPQSLFGAVLFPVFPTVPTAASPVVDPAQYEADLYINGFAQIVHAYQPVSADATVGNNNTLVPGTDAGFQIGWDDVQVTRWFNRQVQAAQAMAGNNPADEFPLGVQGYRVDTRQVPNGTADPASPNPPWHSLVNVSASVSAGDSYSATATEEMTVEPTPVGNGTSPTNFWLPRYFAHWRGRSLIVADKYGYAFGTGGPQTPYPQNPSAPQFSGSMSEVIDIGLRYGNWYQFRTRLSDLSGGGPTVDDDDAGAGVATVQFLRYVPPKATDLALDQPTAPTTINVTRPRLNYPEMVFAGAADQTDLDNFLAAVQAVTGTPPIPASSYPSVAMPDPDVEILEIIVEAQAPKHDTGNPASMQDLHNPPQTGDLDGNYRVVYRQQIPFSGDSMSLTMSPQAIPDIVSWTPPPPSTTIVVPTGRNLRVRLRGLGSGDPAYWGSTLAATGLSADLRLRYESPTETGVIADASDPAKLAAQLQAFYLREDPSAMQQAVVAGGIQAALVTVGGDLAPGLQNALSLAFQSTVPTPIQNLAQALQLPVDGMTLSAPPGQRVVFGAQHTLRCSITQDGSSITFSSMKDLIGHWIVAIRLTVDRDWTWTGLAQNGANQTGFLFSGASTLEPSSPPAPAEIGRIQLPGVVAAISTQEPVNRDQTELIFFATIDSTVPPNTFPNVITTSWSLTATFTGAPTATVPLWKSLGDLQLPITLPPHQTPKLVSAGLAESPYVVDGNYAATEQRQRSLWVEFDSPPADPNDSYYYRILGYGPDPLLVSYPTDMPAQTEPALPIDPEWIRMIAAHDTNDDAGVGAMTLLDGATAPVNAKKQPVHYIVPLPDTVSDTDLQLFGFWTVELRVGHTLWSTAQARYGRALRASGVQFPPPPLVANVDRQPVPPPPAPAVPSIVAMADLAQTVNNGVSLTFASHPQTEIWFLLYAQVQRVDGQAWRNILLARTLGQQIEILGTHFSGSLGQIAAIPVYGVFAESAVEAALKKLQLPSNTPLSVLAVELFNGEANVIPLPTGPQIAARVDASVQEDPLGANLGARRVLRVSPLTTVRAVC